MIVTVRTESDRVLLLGELQEGPMFKDCNVPGLRGPRQRVLATFHGPDLAPLAEIAAEAIRRGGVDET